MVKISETKGLADFGRAEPNCCHCLRRHDRRIGLWMTRSDVTRNESSEKALHYVRDAHWMEDESQR